MLLLATGLFFESCNDTTTTTGVVLCETPSVQKGGAADTARVEIGVINDPMPILIPEIKGKILDEGSGLPVASAEVRIVGSKQKAVTDPKGRFSLTSDNNNTTVILEVNAQHFYTKTIQLNSKSDWTHVNVMINEKAFIMGEIAADYEVRNDTIDCKKEKQ
jgi:hypothetical protein